MDALRSYIFIGLDCLCEAPGRPGLSPEAAAGLPLALRRSFRQEGPGGAETEDPLFECGRLEAPADAGADWRPDGLFREPLRTLIGLVPESEARVLLKAMALANWLESARYCGRCGQALADCEPESPEEGGRKCPACGLLVFPRISPAVIVLVRRGPEILLAHNRRFTGRRFGLIAGFVEAGETVEDCARREIREEAGLEVRDLTYRYSQPWPFPDSLMLAFTAEWASGEARPDGEEIDELLWSRPGERPEIPPPGSVARRLIDEFGS